MRVAVSSNGKNLDAQLDPRFGRCQYFLMVNPDDMSFETMTNESAARGGGAGVQAARFLASQEVEAVITGNCGPNAVQTLAAAGIELIGGQAGTVREVVERFKNGHLTSIDEATVGPHFGLNAATGSGREGVRDSGGGGIGRSMRGRRGTGRGMGMRCLAEPTWMDAGPQSKDQEMENLKRQADSLNQKMKEVISRINRLENQ